MNVVDLHPEELIDKLSDRELTLAERERLDSHLAQCSSCRFEISVRADLAHDTPLFEERPQLTVAGCMAQRVQTSAELPEAAEHAAPRTRVAGSLRPRSRRWRPLALLAASLILCAGWATAAVATGAVAAPAWLPWSPAVRKTEATRAVDAKFAHHVKLAVKSSMAAPVVAAPAVPSAADALVAPEPSAAPAAAAKELASPVAVRPVAGAAVRARQEVTASVSVASAVSPASVPAVAAFPEASEPAAPRLDPAASLFADANRARRDGNPDRAVALYHSLQARFPNSSESELSRALLAQLLLDRGSPEQALAGFDRYLSEGAPVLSAEALVGRARALEQLGKPEQAKVAWQQVQSRFPGTVHARLAAARLAALGMR
ncbi:MAG: tetratricopeptide repeat protein [Polyangiaceae bacterium]